MKIIFIMIYVLMGIKLMAVEVVATVNGSIISQEDVNAFVVSSIPGANFNVLTNVQKKSVINQMVDRKLFLEDAKKTKIAKNPDFIEALNKIRENLMLDYWMKEKVEEIIIDDREAKIYYRDNLLKFNKPASIKVRHILLTTEREALEIIQELNLNRYNLREKFITLAKEKSTGPSAINGGELDWFILEQMVPEFSEAAFALKKGTITTQAIKTQFGYHVIYLEDKKEKGIVPFETVKANIVKALRLSKFKTKLEKLSKKLKKTAKITVK
jgi:parvulin-like peptidyl-prolyl isomerase